MKKIITIILGALLISASCQKEKLVKPKPLTNDDSSWCVKGCEHIKELGCKEANDLVYQDKSCNKDKDCEDLQTCKAGYCTDSCATFCMVTIANGRYLGPECWTSISKCSEIDTVCRR